MAVNQLATIIRHLVGKSLSTAAVTLLSNGELNRNVSVKSRDTRDII